MKPPTNPRPARRSVRAGLENYFRLVPGAAGPSPHAQIISGLQSGAGDRPTTDRPDRRWAPALPSAKRPPGVLADQTDGAGRRIRCRHLHPAGWPQERVRKRGGAEVRLMACSNLSLVRRVPSPGLLGLSGDPLASVSPQRRRRLLPGNDRRRRCQPVAQPSPVMPRLRRASHYDVRKIGVVTGRSRRCTCW